MNLYHGTNDTELNLSNSNTAAFCRMADIEITGDGSTPISYDEFHHKLNDLLSLFDGLCDVWSERLLDIYWALEDASPNSKISFF